MADETPEIRNMGDVGHGVDELWIVIECASVWPPNLLSFAPSSRSANFLNLDCTDQHGAFSFPVILLPLWRDQDDAYEVFVRANPFNPWLDSIDFAFIRAFAIGI